MNIGSEEGSIVPLGIGVLVLTSVFVLVCVEIVGVQMQSMRVKQLGDTLALEVASQLESDRVPPVIGLNYLPSVSAKFQKLSQFLNLSITDARIQSNDGKTIESMFCVEWRSVTGISFGNFGKVCESSKARAI